MFLGKTLNPHSTSLHPGVNCLGNITNCWELTYNGLASRPGGLVILLTASCCKN